MASSIKLPSVRKRKGKAWSSDEARQFLESARSEQDPLYAVYVLILVLGLRKGEVLGLTWDDVDLDEGELSDRTPASAGKSAIAAPGNQDSHLRCHAAATRRLCRRIAAAEGG